MNYFKVVVGLLMMFASSPSNSRPNPSYASICYEFKEDVLINYDTCVVSTGNSAGVLYTTLKYNNKKYKLDNSVGNGETWTLNGLTANEYTRDPYYLERTKFDELVQYEDPIIYCYESSNTNICHN